mgnify:CR=1 FL=1
MTQNRAAEGIREIRNDVIWPGRRQKQIEIDRHHIVLNQCEVRQIAEGPAKMCGQVAIEFDGDHMARLAQ